MTLETTDCDWTQEHLEPYLADALAGADEDRMAQHLTACRRCAAEVALAARVEFELGELPSFDLPAERIERIKRLARGEESVAAAPVVTLADRRPRRRLWPVALAASLLTAALIAGWPTNAPPAPPTAAEVAAAEREARYALALVAQIGRRAGSQLRDDVLVERVAAPVADGLGRSLNRARREG